MVSHEATITGLARTEVLSEGSSGEWLASKLTYNALGSQSSCWPDSVPLELLDWGPQFLAGCGPKATLTSLHTGLSPIDTCFIKAGKRARGPASKTGITILCILIVQVIWHYLRPLPLSHTQGERVTWDVQSRKLIIGTISEFACHCFQHSSVTVCCQLINVKVTQHTCTSVVSNQ